MFLQVAAVETVQRSTSITPILFIRGTNYSAIRAESRNYGGIASVYFQNNLQIDLNRQTEDNFQDSNVYAVYLKDGHLTVDGTADISVKANANDNYAMGMLGR